MIAAGRCVSRKPAIRIRRRVCGLAKAEPRTGSAPALISRMLDFHWQLPAMGKPARSPPASMIKYSCACQCVSVTCHRILEFRILPRRAAFTMLSLCFAKALMYWCTDRRTSPFSMSQSRCSGLHDFISHCRNFLSSPAEYDAANAYASSQDFWASIISIRMILRNSYTSRYQTLLLY